MTRNRTFTSNRGARWIVLILGVLAVMGTSAPEQFSAREEVNVSASASVEIRLRGIVDMEHVWGALTAAVDCADAGPCDDAALLHPTTGARVSQITIQELCGDCVDSCFAVVAVEGPASIEIVVNGPTQGGLLCGAGRAFEPDAALAVEVR